MILSKGILVNREQLHTLVDMGCPPGMLLDTWNEVVTQVEGLLLALSQAVSDRDQSRGREVLHQIKSSMDTYGAVAVADACKAPEWITSSAATERLTQIQNDFRNTDQAIREILRTLAER